MSEVIAVIQHINVKFVNGAITVHCLLLQNYYYELVEELTELNSWLHKLIEDICKKDQYTSSK